jgi:hypothetical protein
MTRMAIPAPIMWGMILPGSSWRMKQSDMNWRLWELNFSCILGAWLLSETTIWKVFCKLKLTLHSYLWLGPWTFRLLTLSGVSFDRGHYCMSLLCLARFINVSVSTWSFNSVIKWKFSDRWFWYKWVNEISDYCKFCIRSAVSDHPFFFNVLVTTSRYMSHWTSLGLSNISKW